MSAVLEERTPAAADDHAAARHRDRDRVAGLSAPVDARQLRRLAGRRLPGPGCFTAAAGETARLLRRDGRGRRDAPAQHRVAPCRCRDAAMPASCSTSCARCAASAARNCCGSRCARATTRGRAIYERSWLPARRPAPPVLPGRSQHASGRPRGCDRDEPADHGDAAMSWDERQVAMLNEMGLRVWSAASADPVVEEEGGAEVAPRRSRSPRLRRAAHRRCRSAHPPQHRWRPPVARGPRPTGVGDHGLADAARDRGRLHRLQVVQRAQADRVRHRQRKRPLDDRRRGAGRAGRPAGLPFVGKSGQLLDNMLRAVGLTRGEAEPRSRSTSPTR